ncbi:MAG: 16S rRNA (adenine(1518)-N(6)/adenine(1519)-N(6))-dimethyltransferase [Firmicutes bacterium]|nr:16S rRNA (adenine(1518)-N(6)/adenine(1519)-N(6))-dimethyltransferase [Bacillota bacterium]MCL2255928.1 16S rRNA (adenine(1518)-N(6)/adenine(1519)-N(6))-dimethyltransferase [Bacillota bacterium]
MHFFKKSLGQNFIYDTNLLKSIVSDALVCREDTVVEVGAGAGTLTKAISETAKRVISFEVDKDLFEPLLKLNLKNTEFIFEDALKYPLEELHKKLCDGSKITGATTCRSQSEKEPVALKKEKLIGSESLKISSLSPLSSIHSSSFSYKLVANLPYYITTPLLFKFLEDNHCESITIMLQKEVAMRTVAKENTVDYGILSVICQAMSNITYNRTVSKKMFTPMPNVDSAVITLKKDLKPNINNIEHFKRVVKASFAMRRKTLSNNLMKEFSIPREKTIEILQAMKKHESIRGETLSVEEFITLSNLIKSQ